MISPRCVWAVLERVLLALWVGAIWSVGFVVAPVLFAELDRPTAGSIAGILFQYLNIGGLCIGAFLLLRNRLAAGGAVNAPTILLLLMLASILTNEFVLGPKIAALREAGLVAGSEAATLFGRLHGAASVLYLCNALFGLTLLVTGPHTSAGCAQGR